MHVTQGCQCGEDVFSRASETIQRCTDLGDDTWRFHCKHHVYVASKHSIFTDCLYCASIQISAILPMSHALLDCQMHSLLCHYYEASVSAVGNILRYAV